MHRLKHILIFLFLLFFYPLLSQQSVDTISLRSTIDKADSFDLHKEKDSIAFYYKLAIEDIEKLDLDPNKLNYDERLSLYRIINRAGLFFDTHGFYQEALTSYLLSYNFIEVLNDSDKKAMVLNRVGAAYLKIGEWDSSEKYFKTALVILEKAEYPDYSKIAQNYNNLAIFYANKNNLDLTGSYFTKALNIIENNLGKNFWYAANLCSNLGELSLHRLEYDKALRFFKKALRINFKNNSKNGIANSYNNIGRAYLFQGNYSDALIVLKKAEKLFVELYTKVHPYTSSVYDGIGDALIGLENYEGASIAFEQSLKSKKKSFGSIHGKVAESYLNIAKVKNKGKYYESESNYLDSAFYSLGVKNLDTMVLNDTGSYPMFFLLMDLRLKNLMLLDNQNENLEKAECVCREALRSYDDFRKTLDTESGTQGITTQMNGIYQTCISINIALFNKTNSEKNYTQALRFSERSKFESLVDRINIPHLLKDEKSLQNLVQIEDSLKGAILAIKQELNTKQILENQERIVLEDALFEEYKNLQNIIDQIKIDHPDFFNLRYNNEFVDVQAIQNYIPNEETALLEYFINKETINVFFITKTAFEVLELPLLEDLEKVIYELRRGVYFFHLDSSDNAVEEDYLDTLFNSSKILYENIFKPIEDQLDLPQRLILIPDGVLGYIPFEILLREKPEDPAYFNQHRYLIKDYQISYGYSATLLNRIKQKGASKNPKNLIAFAPEFVGPTKPVRGNIEQNRAGLGKLEYNIEEALSIKDILDADVYDADLATKEAFLQHANQYKIIHLSTHGKADDQQGDYSYLAFSKEPKDSSHKLLYNRELYLLSLESDLVVLSACETGIGTLKKGEGIISMARGFSYAGTRSIITSLWSVDDKKTMELMTSFYENIKDGMKKDRALHLAKLDFISNHTVDAHPFYWSAFIPIGDMSPIKLKSEKKWKLIGGGVCLFILLVIYFKK